MQVAEQVGELMIHCRYGCKPAADVSGKYVVDPSGELLCKARHVGSVIVYINFCHQ